MRASITKLGERERQALSEGAQIIPLTKGLFAIVDSDDAERVSQHCWYAHSGANAKWKNYAMRNLDWRTGRKVYLHHFVLNREGHKITLDHINGDALDNRKANLRIASTAQNVWNTRKRKDNTTGYKGVRQLKNGQFQARAQVNGRRVALGAFSSLEGAAEAYRMAVRAMHGEFARTA